MRVVALTKPTEIEKGQWYFRRYIKELPEPGELVFFDRSWYNRAVVEPVNGFCSAEEYDVFMNQVNSFEKMIIDSGIRLVKFYFSISKDEQCKDKPKNELSFLRLLGCCTSRHRHHILKQRCFGFHTSEIQR